MDSSKYSQLAHRRLYTVVCMLVDSNEAKRSLWFPSKEVISKTVSMDQSIATQ